MPKVGIVMGSDSDLKVMSKAAATLQKFGIDYEMTIISAHRMPDVFFDWAKAAEGKGHQSNYCRSRYGSTSAGNVCSVVPCRLSESRCQEKILMEWMQFFYRSDATWNPGCYRCDRRR